MSAPTTACIIGAGPGGIAMAYQLKKRLRCNDFIIVDQNPGVGGTWLTNTYPGCGCDVPSHFYSYSFALNADWSRPLCEQREILAYLESVVERFDLRGHLKLSTKVIGATWNEKVGLWNVEFETVRTGHRFTRNFNVVVSACGIFSRPKFPDMAGIDKFKGVSWHTGQWNWEYNIEGKRVVVIGNGCSGCQVIPAIAQKVGTVTHLTRSRQWLFDRPNMPFSLFARWLFRTFPGYLRWHRFSIYYNVDSLWLEYIKNPLSGLLRELSEKEAREYMTRKTPAKYLKDIMPDYPVGCKRRVLDPGYLDALHCDNVDLCSEKISEIDETGIQLANGEHIDADVIVYATGFHTQEYLSPMIIIGQDGKSLNEHWQDTDGCQAYLGTTVSTFPNLAIMFGPNASPAHNSVIYILEVQASYISQTFFEPLLCGRAKIITVKRSAEEYDCNLVQQKLTDSVWHAGCTNWTLDKNGRNCTNFPGYVRSFWWKLLWPKWGDYILTGGNAAWPLKYASLKASRHSTSILVVLIFCLLGGYGRASGFNAWRLITST